MSDAVIISAITGVVSLITPLLILLLNYKLTGIHKQINSRMDQLLESAKALSKSEGKLEEADDERKRKSI